MKVSIIIPVYNGEKTIKRAVNSCINQNHSNLEIIVVDNASNDLTSIILQELIKKDSRIIVKKIDQKGRSLARNLGINYASGDFIQFLDADDELDINKISRGVGKIKDFNVFAHASSISYKNDILKKQNIFNVPEISFNDLLYINYFPINSILFKNDKKVFFDETLEYNEDWLYWITLLENEKIYFDSDYIGGQVHITGNNTMSNIATMTQHEMFVRQKVKHLRKGIEIKNIITEFKVFLLYQNIKNKDKKIEQFVKEKSPCMYLLSKIIIDFYPTKKLIKLVLERKQNKRGIVY